MDLMLEGPGRNMFSLYVHARRGHKDGCILYTYINTVDYTTQWPAAMDWMDLMLEGPRSKNVQSMCVHVQDTYMAANLLLKNFAARK